MKKFYLLFMSISFALAANAQKSVIHGKIIDTTSNQTLANAVVMLIGAKDSMLQNFTRVNTDGSFSLKNIDTGKYILLVSYPQYADYSEPETVDGKQSAIDLGTIKMIGVEHLLYDVVVTQQLGSIKIKGDTTEFIADSFKTQPNASVEDLLKKFPGFQVDKNGKITAQGKTVQKVLVDGEEFFGDDPTLVTKNLRADMVGTVQLYDKSSDQAAFTGIDDGQKTTTLNIKLKADKKNGYFGKISAGIGTDKFYQSQDMFNYFKGKKKFAAYGTFGNTGQTGLNWQDELKYGSSSGISTSVTDDGGVSISIQSSGDDPLSSWNGTYDGAGIPDVKTGGVHYDNKWDNDNQAINLNYKIGGMAVNGNSQTTTQSNLPTGILYTQSNDNFKNNIFRQKADGSYDLQFDTTSSLKITLGGSLAHSTTYDTTTTLSYRNLDTLINDAYHKASTTGNTQAFNASALWKKKLKKKGRTLSISFNEYLNNKNNSGFLYNKNDYYNLGNIDSTSLTDQFKKNKSQSNSIDSKITYTEPLSKTISAIIDYGIDVQNATSDVRSYNNDGAGNYDILDSVYSNHYIYNQFTNAGGLAFNYKKGKLNFNLGTDVGNTKYTQTNTFTTPQQNLDRNFITWNPKANLRYKVSSNSNLTVNYYGSTQQPSITQIQPVLNNSNSLNTYIGNPDLKPSFRNSVSFFYNSYKVLSERNIFIGGNYSFTTNPIATNISTDLNTGQSTISYLNVPSSTSNYWLQANYGRKWKKLDLRYNFSFNINGNRNLSLTNDTLNKTTGNTYSLNVGLGKDKEKKYSLWLSANAGYNTNTSNLQSQINNNGWIAELQPSADVYLPAKFQIHTDGDYNWQQKTQSFTGRNQFIWNAWVGKKFFQKENLLFKISVNDILNQNNGFSRQATSNGGFQQTINSTIKRYFMASVVWDFTKMGGAAAGNK